jgi:hypothetical protein
MEGENRKIKVSLTEDQPVDEDVRGSLQNFIAGLAVPQKVELAAKGNREVRQILSRDQNKMVARAVMSSPRLSDADIVSYAASALTNDEVLRVIAENREYMNNHNVLWSVISNPRSPVSAAMRFLLRLNVNELNLISHNRSISALVRREAKRLAIRRR